MLRILLLTILVTAAYSQDRSFNNWAEYLGGADSSQYSSLKQINKTNVKQLEVVWTYPTSEQYLFNPIVVDGTMYVQAKSNSLVALDAATGRELWSHAFQGTVTTRGINYWESRDRASRRLFTINAGFLTAIDARTGQTVLSFGDNGRADLRTGLDRDLTYVPPIQTNNPGRIFENIMIVPLMRSGADYAYVPGDIHAFDVVSGKLLWQFHTVPRPGEPGYETWPKDFWLRSGGGINWNELTIDQKRGIAYIPTGTGKFDHYGADRIGQNLYANSVIALDARTGKRLWHFQTVHHDLWDYDLPAGPKLLTVKHDGKNVDVVIQPTKHGFLFVLDRVTGAPLWPIEERPVPKSDMPGEQAWPTQPFPTKPPAFARQTLTENELSPFLSDDERTLWRDKLHAARNEGLFTPPSLRGTLAVPGVGGGASWGTAAVDPTKGTLYIMSKDAPTIITLVAPGSPNGDARAKQPVMHQPLPEPIDGAFQHYTAPYTNLISQSTRLPVLALPWAQLTAYDLNAGTILWQVPYGTAGGHEGSGVVSQRGGPVVTAGGLIFSATNDQKLRAYDQDSGKVIWETTLPAAAEGVPAVFELAGREYLAICAASTKPGAYIVYALPRR